MTIKQFLKNPWPVLANWVSPNTSQFFSTRQHLVWSLSLIIGLGVAIAAIIFRELIGAFQWLWLGTNAEGALDEKRAIAWWIILAAPTIGGLIVGLLLSTIKSRRTFNVADVIEARALASSKLPFRDGLKSAGITAVSLGFGASAGREGPVVHLGATIAAGLARRFQLAEWCRRTLLSAGVASAISASFNAPIAGVLFAHEVILGHYSMRSFVPIVIASTAGAVMSRIWFGDVVAFEAPTYEITSYFEFPAFVLLGIVSAAVAVLFQFALFSTDFVARSITIPLWTRPVIGGFLVGLIALIFPQVLGVGYATTDLALWNSLPLGLMLALIVAKTAATAITLASRFGGGIFSPALYLGALAGSSFGAIATSIFPQISSSDGLYAILGMGAVAGAVLGAPISTTMIVFELTGGYALSIALLLTCAIAHGVTQAVHGHSYFHWQLEMRGLFVFEGPHRTVTTVTLVMDFMEPLDEPEDYDTESATPRLKPTDTLDAALRLFDEGGHTRLPVCHDSEPHKIIGFASHVRALRYFNKALVEASEEEHR